MVGVYAAVRQFVFNDGKSRREAALISSAHFGRRYAFQMDAWRAFLHRKDDVPTKAHSRLRL